VCGAYHGGVEVERRVDGVHLEPVRPARGSYLRLIDSCITQLKAQGTSRTCNESKEEGEEARGRCSANMTQIRQIMALAFK